MAQRDEGSRLELFLLSVNASSPSSIITSAPSVVLREWLP